MHGNRIERVQEEVRREIGAILQQRSHDPRLTWVSVVRVEISRDLTHAKVFVSSLGEPAARAEALRALEKASAFLRGELSRRIQLRRIPELHFREDLGIATSLRISELLAENEQASRSHEPSSAPKPTSSEEPGDDEVSA